MVNDKKAANEEDSAAKLRKLAEEMRFRIREAMVQRGGSEAFCAGSAPTAPGKPEVGGVAYRPPIPPIECHLQYGRVEVGDELDSWNIEFGQLLVAG